MTETTSIAVLGAGSWGTALAVHLARSHPGVTLWARDAAFAALLETERHNSRYLPDALWPESLAVTSELSTLGDAEVLLVVVPSHGFRAVLRDYLEHHPGPRRGAVPTPLVVVSATKGIEAETTARMSQVCFEEGLAVNREIHFAVVSGPSFAAELASGQPTAAVVASEEAGLAARIRDLFSANNLRLYSSSDVVGVEIGGTAKNVIAIASGCAAGLGFGSNTLAALMTRGLHEVTRLGLASGGRQRTFSGLAGMGDLVLTCTGGLSRNRSTGIELARGRSLEEIQAATSMVAEGVKNARTLALLARQRGVEMPITQQMVAVLYDDKAPRTAVEELMQRDLKDEAVF